jgi:hypothetical protein
MTAGLDQPDARPESPPALPPFESVLKSRDVEDPVNLWLHRPLAYAFVALVYRTSITPNQITLLSLLVGLASAVGFVIGTPAAMIYGGILLWSSAILDGADGILARGKRMFSDVGRAIDGCVDAVVALASVSAAFYHIWIQHHSWLELGFMPVAVGTTLFHVYSFDFYKEAYLQHTSLSWSGRPERLTDVDARLQNLRATHAPWYAVVSTQTYRGLLETQMRVIARFNPEARRHHLVFPVSSESVRLYRQFNRGPMQLWALVSTAPHAYLISICAMFDRLDVYLWIRVILMNAVFLWACFWQQVATHRTNHALAAAGLAPHLPEA